MDIVTGITAVWGAVGEAVKNQGANLLSYAAVLAAVGTLAMAIVEILKSVFRALLWFNKWRVAQWTSDAKGVSAAAFPSSSRPDPVLAELLLLAVGGARHWRTLFDQPVEKMMGQIQAAANVALEYPKDYPHLYTWLTAVPAAYWERGASDATRNDGKKWAEHIDVVNKIRAMPAGAKLAAKEVTAAQEASKARARLNNLVARKLDAFQNNTQYKWARWNQYSATIISIAIFLFALWDSVHGAAGFFQYALLALPAGVIAPFAKDLTGSLSSFTRK
jgi:hypothetical protein